MIPAFCPSCETDYQAETSDQAICERACRIVKFCPTCDELPARTVRCPHARCGAFIPGPMFARKAGKAFSCPRCRRPIYWGGQSGWSRTAFDTNAFDTRRMEALVNHSDEVYEAVSSLIVHDNETREAALKFVFDHLVKDDPVLMAVYKKL